ncbi:MAG: hypothetical protein AAF629_27465 [Chloroflexota bacterium]
MKQSSYIALQPVSGQEKALSTFLKEGAQIVQETEPETLLWTALQSPDLSQCAIFDTFPTEGARDAHFAGQVAAALNANASTLVEGGWDNGVVPNIHNAVIIGSKVSTEAKNVSLATWIPFKARAGKVQDLADLLAVGAKFVADKEPQTLFWFALQIDDNHFGIIDFFADQAGIDAHFAGDAAAALHDNAANLIEGGWEQGVLSGIQQFNALAFLTR